MPNTDDTPRTRTEKKRQGKERQGPYSAKHVRLVAALAERKPSAPLSKSKQ